MWWNRRWSSSRVKRTQSSISKSQLKFFTFYSTSTTLIYKFEYWTEPNDKLQNSLASETQNINKESVSLGFNLLNTFFGKENRVESHRLPTLPWFAFEGRHRKTLIVKSPLKIPSWHVYFWTTISSYYLFQIGFISNK